MVGDAHLPLLQRHLPGPGRDLAGFVDTALDLGPAEHERSGIDRVGEQIVDRRIGGLRPANPACARRAARQQEAIAPHGQQDLPGGAQLGEAAEHGGDRLGDGLVGAHHHAAVLVVVEPDGQALAKITACCLVPQPGVEAGAQQVELRFAHRALEAEDEPVVVVPGVIEPVGIGDQGVGEGAQVQQVIPVGVVAGEAGHLDPQDDPDLAQPDGGDQGLEAAAGRGIRARAAQVLVDHADGLRRPPHRRRSLRQLVLAGKALGVMVHLGHGRLAHVHPRRPAQVHRADLAGQLTHRRPPGPPRRHPWRSVGPTGTGPRPVPARAAGPNPRPSSGHTTSIAARARLSSNLAKRLTSRSSLARNRTGEPICVRGSRSRFPLRHSDLRAPVTSGPPAGS